MRRIIAVFKDETGATAIEYGMVAMLIGLAIVVAIKSVGSNMSTMYSGIAVNVDR